MNYNEKHILELQDNFKLTEREARFVWIVANATGYFLRKHIYTFFKSQNSGATTKFIEKLKKKRLIKEFVFANKTKVYHLNSKRVYTVLEQENSRLRKQHENIYIAKRLLILSFIIKNLDKNYLFTEQEKVNFFKQKLGINEYSLPFKIYKSNKTKNETVRYFIDRYPIIFSQNSLSRSPVVAFIYPHSGLNTSLSDFQTYLDLYKKLFSKLQKFNLIFISTKNTIFEKAEKKFNDFFGKKDKKKRDKKGDLIDELQRFFELREARESKNYKVFQGDNAVWFFEVEKKFKTDFIDDLFEEWKRKGREKEVFLDKFKDKEELKVDIEKTNFIPYYEGKIDEIFEYSY